MTENNNRDFGPQDSMSWNTSSLAWVFAANTRAALDDPERRVRQAQKQHLTIRSAVYTVICGTLYALRAQSALI